MKRLPKRARQAAIAGTLAGDFSALYSRLGRPSIPPEKLLRAMLLQAFYSIRSERQLMDRLEFDLLFRWFVGIGVTMRCGITRHFPRTAIGCWKATSQPNYCARFWRSRGLRGCSARIISRSTAR
jgi:hypothetical protein